MNILHTADWHIGQVFHEYDRTFEHRQFLNWLIDTLDKEQIDVLLISGDIFDMTNPSAASIRMFYTFLNQAATRCPKLQIIVTAGNHDSASRLEAPKPLLESSQIHIIGLVEKDETGAVDYDKLTIPLKNRDGSIGAWCIAAPFLRLGDYPSLPDTSNPYAEGVAAFYRAAVAYADTKRIAGQAIIAMGHLHAQRAEVTESDNSERLIMGGIECISAAAFDDKIRYVALGHIHKAQRVGRQDHIRYCGSPLPMSFSETNYKHQVIVFQLTGDEIKNLRNLEIPLVAPLHRVPDTHHPLPDVLTSLHELAPFDGDPATAPYLEVRVLLEGPEPALRHKVETAVAGKNYRLARINVRYPTPETKPAKGYAANAERLSELQPKDILEKVYRTRYGQQVPQEISDLFRQVVQETNDTDTDT